MWIASGFDLNHDKRADPPHHSVNFVERFPKSTGKIRISFGSQQTCHNAAGLPLSTLDMFFPSPVHGQYYHAVYLPL